MTGEKFAEIVTKRADVRVQIKLMHFKKEVNLAFEKLTGSQWVDKSKASEPARMANFQILERMVEKEDLTFTDGWPRIIWEKEEILVSTELLSMMDEMQKALLAPGPQEGDCTPAVEKVEQ